MEFAELLFFTDTLFRIVIGCILHVPLWGRWLPFTLAHFLKYLNYADGCLFSDRVMVLGQMALNLEKDASRVGVKIKTSKTKVLKSDGLSHFSLWVEQRKR